MSCPGGPLAAQFPTPPESVINKLDELRTAAIVPPETEQALRDAAMIYRPWDPPSCPAELRRDTYRWLDQVVGWINEEHTWRTDRVIPNCWDLHPHIVHEFATVASLRWEATYALTPKPLDDWHQITLPKFLERIADRIGETGCPPGRHQPSPGAGRIAAYREGEEPGRRRRHLFQDEDSGTTYVGGRSPAHSDRR